MKKILICFVFVFGLLAIAPAKVEAACNEGNVYYYLLNQPNNQEGLQNTINEFYGECTDLFMQVSMAAQAWLDNFVEIPSWEDQYAFVLNYLMQYISG